MHILNENLARNQHDWAAGRPTPDAAWTLLGHAFTGYDWHGGLHAHPVDDGQRAPRRVAGFGPGTVVRRIAARWRSSRELRRLGSAVRADAGLVEVTRTMRRPERADVFWQQVASWAHGRVPGDPCGGQPC